MGIRAPVLASHPPPGPPSQRGSPGPGPALSRSAGQRRLLESSARETASKAVADHPPRGCRPPSTRQKWPSPLFRAREESPWAELLCFTPIPSCWSLPPTADHPPLPLAALRRFETLRLCLLIQFLSLSPCQLLSRSPSPGSCLTASGKKNAFLQPTDFGVRGKHAPCSFCTAWEGGFPYHPVSCQPSTPCPTRVPAPACLPHPYEAA